MKHFGCPVLYLVFILLLHAFGSHADVTQISASNLDGVLKTKLVFVNFYADWCRFSRMLEPIFKDAAALVSKEFASTEVIFGRVDCDAEQPIAQKFSVNKYPTMKLFRNGIMTKREYRGQRTGEAIASFIREQLKDPVKEVKNLDEIYEIKRDKRTIVGYFDTKESPQYQNFDAVSKLLKDDCDFYAAFGEISKPERTSGDNVIFKPIGENNAEMVYLGSLANKDLLQAWTQDKCVPLVREITFQNGEELTEEGLPFLILFHSKEDTESLEAYSKEVSRLISFKTAVNFLVADCETFSHPLHHLGKSVKDCPLLAIDSFRHMYMFPDFAQIGEPNKLKQFLLDLQSGKLHREFHHGPDPNENKIESKTPGQVKMEPVVQGGLPNLQVGDVPDLSAPGQPIQQAQATLNELNEALKKAEEVEATGTVEPPINTDSTTIKSVFANLKPSQHRYTIVDYSRDEL